MKKFLTTKVIITVVIVLLVCAVAIWGILGLKNSIKSSVQNGKLVDEVNAEIDTNKVSLTQSQFNTLASKLHTAMNGMGTDEDSIYDAFKTINSRSDLLQLIKTFGVKDGETLKEWLYDDLSSSDIQHINEILASKNINYAF